MKKLLLLGVMAFAGLTSQAVTVEGYLDRSSWTVTACSWISEGGGSGPASAMIDDNLNTYYHQNWSNDTGRGTHWFIIDMGSEQEIDGVDIWGRQGHLNGHILEGKIYLSTTAFEAFADHDAAKAYYEDEANEPVATINYEYAESTRNDVQSSRFASTNARYILVVTNATSANHLCVAEVKAHQTIDIDTRIDIDRTGWNVTPCSWIADGGSNGPISNIFDDDLSTYWHSNWSNDKAMDAYHWLMIDMGASDQINGFKYWRRQGNSNGQFLKGKVYVSETPFTSFADHDAAKAFHDDAANEPAATFTFTYTEDADGVRVCEFPKAATGRYVLVILSEAGANSVGRHACCSEFKLFKDASAAEAMWNFYVNHKTYAYAYNELGLISHLVSGELPSINVPADATEANVKEKAVAFNNAVNAYIQSFDKVQVVIKNHYRRADKPYMGVVTVGNTAKINTVAAGNPDAVWEICVVDGGIQLYNRTTGYYIGASQNLVFAANAQTYTLRSINGDYVAFAKGNSNNLLNVDGGSNNLTSWSDLSDQGSSWEVALANAENCVYANPEVSTADAPKFYRIVNARWMWSRSAPGMAVNGENQDGNGNGETNKRSEPVLPGAYWRVESVNDESGVKLINLTGYELTFDGQNPTTLTDNGSTFYLVKQEDAQFNGYNVYAISSEATPTSNSCIDVSGDGTKVCWNPVNEGRGNNNNGSAWYFIPATDSEVAIATNTYINSIITRCNIGVDSALDELFGEGFAQSITPYEATVAGVNAAKHTEGLVDGIQDAVNAKVPELVGRHYLLHNKNTSYSNCYMTLTTDDEGNSATAPTSNAADVNALWSFIPSGEGYLVTSEATGKALTLTKVQSAPIPAAEEGLPYSIAYNQTVKGFYISLIPCEQNADDIYQAYYSIHQSNNDNVCKWIANNIPGSHWMLEPAAELEEELELEIELGVEEGTHQIVLPEGVELNTHESAANHVITITPQVPEEISLFAVEPGEDGVHTIAASDFTDGKAQISGLQEGNYVLSVPAGMFIVNGKPSAAHNLLFAVDADGYTTGIEEVAPAVAAETVVYDLQGRRVNGNAKGLLIVNGQKVYRK